MGYNRRKYQINLNMCMLQNTNFLCENGRNLEFFIVISIRFSRQNIHSLCPFYYHKLICFLFFIIYNTYFINLSY